MESKELWRQLRSRVKMTRAEMAKATGLSEHTIRAYEKGQRTPSISSLLRLLKVANVPESVRSDVCSMLLIGAKADGFDPLQLI